VMLVRPSQYILDLLGMHRRFDIVVASPLFIGIVLSVLGRAAAIEPSCCWCVGHTSQRLAALLLFARPSVLS
jgi:hypothetical protein